MRRNTATLVAGLVALVVAGVVVNDNIGRQDPGAAYERLADDLGRIVVSPNSTPTNKYGNSCAPAQAAACEQIVQSMVGVVVQSAAQSVVRFVAIN